MEPVTRSWIPRSCNRTPISIRPGQRTEPIIQANLRGVMPLKSWLKRTARRRPESRPGWIAVPQVDDLGNVIGATSIGGRRSDSFTARKLAPGNLGLLQQYRYKRDPRATAHYYPRTRAIKWSNRFGGGLGSSSRPCLVKTIRRTLIWHPEQIKVWCSKPRIAAVFSGTTFVRISSASHAVQCITRTPLPAPTYCREYRTFPTPS
jgi:hypothetical protein